MRRRKRRLSLNHVKPFEVAAARISGLVNLVFSRQTGLFECGFPFVKPIIGRVSILYRIAFRVGVKVIVASPRFGHPHSQNPSDMGNSFSYYLSDLGLS